MDFNPKFESEEGYRKWARDNFDPRDNRINPYWHPTVLDECHKIYSFWVDKTTEKMWFNHKQKKFVYKKKGNFRGKR